MNPTTAKSKESLEQILRTRTKSSYILCQNITRTDISGLVANIDPLWNLWSWFSIAHISLSTTVFQAPANMAMLSALNHFPNPKSHIFLHLQACHGNVPLSGTSFYLCYFSISVKRLHDQGSLEKREFIGDHHGRWHGGRQAGMGDTAVAESLHLTHKHSAKKVSCEWCGFLKPPVTYFLQVTRSNPCHIVPPTGNHASAYKPIEAALIQATTGRTFKFLNLYLNVHIHFIWLHIYAYNTYNGFVDIFEFLSLHQ